MQPLFGHIILDDIFQICFYMCKSNLVDIDIKICSSSVAIIS